MAGFFVSVPPIPFWHNGLAKSIISPIVLAGPASRLSHLPPPFCQMEEITV
jgi:hypothetical protein